MAMCRISPAERAARSHPVMTADLNEALDTVDLVAEALIQSLAGRAPTGLDATALAVTAALRRKHNRPDELLPAARAG